MKITWQDNIKEIKRLRLEAGRLNAGMISSRDMWAEDCYALYDEKQAETGHLKNDTEAGRQDMGNREGT